jgi:inner membrane protein
MDNITHGTLGIIAAILVAPPELRRTAALAGFIAAELPDADILIKSAVDPLFGIQMHRHFTHALVFIPVLVVLGVVLANLLRKLFCAKAVWKGMWLPACAAASTHGLCDTWTSYGTHLLWPFTDRRESWDLISVIDPLFTLPVLVCAIVAWCRGSAKPAMLGVMWAVFYLGLCAVQAQRARDTVRDWAKEHGHGPQRLTVKPSFGNIIVWRGLYIHNGICQVVCVRPGITGGTQILGTDSAPLLDPDKPVPPLTSLPKDSVQARDVPRFAHFSDGWLGVHPARPDVIGDLRYATRPDLINPLWGIVIDPAHPGEHAQMEYFRNITDQGFEELWKMITGEKMKSR